MKIFSVSLFAAGSLLLSGSVLAETTAFKCTAENGDISYLDTKPTTGCAKVEIVRVNVGKGTEGAVDGKASPDADTPPKTDEQEAKELATRKEQVKKDCDAQRANLETLKTKNFIKVKEEDGTVHALTPEEQQQRIKETQDHIDSFCSK